MTPTWAILAFGLVLLVSSASGELSNKVVDYIAYIIIHLSTHNTGTFDLWFYESSTRAAGSNLNELMTLNQTSMLARRVLLSAKQVEIQRSPALVVLSYNSIREFRIGPFLQSQFDRSTKFIVFYDFGNQRELTKAMNLINLSKLQNVIFVRSDSLEIHHKMAYQEEVNVRYGEIPIEELFVDPVGNISGHNFQISTSYIKSSSERVGINEYYADLFTETIHQLGGTVNFRRIVCDVTLPSNVCRRKIFYYNSTTMYDLCADILTPYSLKNNYYMHSIIPNTMIIGSPSGSRLTAFEIFTIPFRPELWIGLVSFLLICTLLMLIFPTLFDNNLILLPVCGFDRRQFHLVSPLEKTVLLTLIVIFFVLLNAYGAIIIAFMTEFPYAPDPRTLDDLLRNGITIRQRVDSWAKQMIEANPRMEQLFSKLPLSAEWDFQKNAFMSDQYFMRYFVSKSDNYDTISGRPRYVVVSDLTLGNMIQSFFTGYRNPLVSKLLQADMRYLEAGLFELYVRELTRQEFGIRQSRYSCADVGIDELKPAWYALAIGSGASFVVLALEIFFKVVCRKRQPIKDFLTQGSQLSFKILSQIKAHIVNFSLVVLWIPRIFLKKVKTNCLKCLHD